jgi:hypothetical protein
MRLVDLLPVESAGSFAPQTIVDFIALMEGSQVNAFVAALQPDFYTDDEYIRVSLQYGRSFNIIHMPSGETTLVPAYWRLVGASVE